MEEFNLTTDVIVFGLQVKNFPSGIDEAFNELIKKTGNRAGERAYYGISEYKDGNMIYYATAEEKTIDEAGKYNYIRLKIDKGSYLTCNIFDWRKKTECIKDAFMK
ncbi:hypothetical protein FW778_15505 [Ginsengibacter hankyongi]|uniref:Uncharacterized protein n=1 Tax=Ginsengibacter hankyongi TaxID=2607284 RepID=A0A5J5IEC4_9BACT|nr:hypothetical protein [Ginsengibacter hankyongi]KAA9038157.1 hypothetical protein FW778_15505 [Ginsengibacter hankyongi]